MTWRRQKHEERKRQYVDHVSPDGRWLCGEGFDCDAAEDGFSWSLFARDGSRWQFVRQFPSLQKAKAFAERGR